jgi:ectoine hydroxylase-related dioxygenase (phytanoyl-CoA dioxygenase family)
MTTTLPRLAGPAVDDAARAQLRRDGFLVVDRLVEPEVVTRLRDAYDDVIAQRVKAAGDRHLGGLIRQVMHPSGEHPVFADNPALQAGLDLAAALFERSDIRKLFEMLIDKPGGTMHETPWHQDAAYYAMPVAPAGVTETGIDNLQVWLALDDVDVDNGCMQFVPAPYGTPLLPHRVAAGDPEDEGRLLAFDGPFDASGAVAAPLAAGGCSVHLPGTPHYTGPNVSTRPRRAYIFNVGAPAGESH